MNSSNNGLSKEWQADLREDSSVVNQIAALVQAAARPGWLHHPHSLDMQYQVSADGKIVGATVAPRKYRALTVAGLVDQVRDLASAPDLDDGGTNHPGVDAGNAVRVFVGDNCVTALFRERGDRLHSVTLGLTRLESFEILREHRLKGIDQTALDWILRSVYPDRVLPNTFLPTVKKLRFKSNSQGASEVGHGRETVDMTVEAELAGVAGGIPDTVVLKTSVYEQLAAVAQPLEIGVKCAVHLDIAGRKFTLKPLEGEVERAARAAREHIAEELARADFPENVKIYIDSRTC